ncbi:TNF receptor-associated factor 3 [Ostrinia nubilalis]|uniref:TNF receptor-associated factor 3 n=1 Tax=Ostrinia nubilalis TaxID=29057 RepID=UPI0030823635
MSLNKRASGEGDGTMGRRNARESACYFCNEMFELGQLQSHLKLCGSILEQCPLRCGAWIQRKHKETHAKDCPQYSKSRSSTSPTHARQTDPVPPPPVSNHTWSPRQSPLDDCVTYLEKEVTNIKMVLTEESSRRDVQSTEIDNLRSKLILVEEKSQHFLSTLVSLRAAVDDEAERAANWAAQFKHDLANVQLALQELQSQQLSTVMRLESTVSSLVHEQHERELLEQALTQHDNKIRAVNNLEEVIEYIKRTVEEERERNAENRAALEAELMEARRSSQQLAQLSAVRMQLQNAANEPTIDRLSILEVSTADARAQAAEHASRMDVISRDLRALTKSYHKVRTELADFQARVNFENSETGSENGHLIWRIDNFSARMKEAKDNDTVLSSPLFRTSKYGYTLKAEVNLNGIGKWKGRHITCTVRLVGGPYDALLEWPCDFGVNIVLKDQPANRSQAMDIVKSLQLRRKSSSKRHDYDSTEDQNQTRAGSTEALDKSVLQLKRQFIFIPHTSLDKFDYVKNDVMFMEFIVNM